MKSMTRLTYITAALVLTTLTGCRKDLCYNHYREVTVTTDYEQEWERNNGFDVRSAWDDDVLGHAYEDFTPAPGQLVACLIYNKDTGTSTITYLTEQTEHITMPAGNNSLMFFNNENDVMEFYNLDDRTTAMCVTVQRSRATYSPESDEEVTVAEPEMMYGCYLSDVDTVGIHEKRDLQAHMTPLVYTYVINVRFDHGLEYVSLARGAVSGMARGVFLRDGGTTAETATILFDECIITNRGLVTKLYAYGPPNYLDSDFNGPAPSRSLYNSSTGNQRLNIEVMLSNGTIKEFYFDISDQIALQPTGGLITVSGARVEDDEAVAGDGSGWDPTLDNWTTVDETLNPTEEK